MLEEPIIPIVVDTNVLVPSLYYRSPIAKFILKGNFILVWNNYTYQEAKRIVEKLSPMYYAKAGVDLDDVLELLTLITMSLGIEVPDMPENWPPVTNDRKDDPFLWAAQCGNAKYIVSEDGKHMVNLKIYKGIPIGEPGSFFSWLKSSYPVQISF